MLTLVREGMYWFDGADDFHMATVKIRVEEEAASNGGHNGAVVERAKMTVSSLWPDNSPATPKTSGLHERSGASLLHDGHYSNCVCIRPYDKTRKLGFMTIPKT